MGNKKYWQSFGELNNSDAHKKNVDNEFREELPLEHFSEKGLLDAKTPRRDFLKYLGFSTAAAMIAASCETPVKKAIPYLNKPANTMPGVADYYATTYISGGDVIPVVAKVRDGRPIKIEGNTLSNITKGGTTARVQASVLDLYDTARLRFPHIDGKEKTKLEDFDKEVMNALSTLGGAPLVLLTATITSPSTKQIIDKFLAKYPGSRHVQYDSISYSGMLLANEACYGKRAIPTYQLEKAKTIVSLGADFLGTWLSPIELQKGYTDGRRINEANIEMSKHYQFESMMTLTGANADERFTHRPSETGVVALSLLNAINGQGTNNVSGNLKTGIEKAAKDLLANKGASVVICGSNDPNVQIIVNAINEAIGANGTSINWAVPLQSRQGIDSDMDTLTADMNAGRVGGIIVWDANPAYDYYDQAKFKEGVKKLKLSVSFNEKMDETSECCKYVIPANNYLESWGDAEAKPGYYSLMQPTIAPLFKTRQAQDSLLIWSGETIAYHEYFNKYWADKLGGEAAYLQALQAGVIEPAAASSGAGYSSGKLGDAIAAVNSNKKGTGIELVLYQKVALGDGKQANNPWLQEMPDPVTKMTWDNYIMMSPALGKKLFDINLNNRTEADKYEAFPEKPVAKVTLAGKELLLPTIIIPGMQDDTIAVAVGYGRSEKIGRAVTDADGNLLGENAYPFATRSGGTISYSLPDVKIEKTDIKYRLAQTQTHGNYEGRKEVMKEVTLESYKHNPKQILEAREKELEPFGGLAKYEKDGTLYGVYDRPGIKWGMSIDLNSCYGCGACVVACTAENNVAVVGKSEVMRAHEMHWLRIDRYFSGDPYESDTVQTVFQPMLCQHCDNAPCENVCPVAATNHSSEGLNQMTYNRCIGTRYCANNCPYKVRRFNWADYTGADSFPDNQEGHLDDSVMMMNDPLSRMVLNPDVTVRSRGVIEKCSFCVQRLQEGKLKAKKEGRTLTDDDVKTACQQACAAGAIVFGNVNNKESAIAKTRTDNKNRTFYVLEQIHVLPNINYLVKVRNADVVRGVKAEEEEAHH